MIARDQDASVENYLDTSNDTLQWNMRFIRDVQVWEGGDISYFFKMLYVSNIDNGEVDVLLWKHFANKMFGVRSLYKVYVLPTS